MELISFSFLIFFFVVAVTYFCLQFSRHWQNAFLLLACYFFYSRWNLLHTGVLLLISISGFAAGYLLDRERFPTLTVKTRRAVAAAAIALNLLVLGFFKYPGFLTFSILPLLGPQQSREQTSLAWLVLPVGISYYTLKNIGHLVDSFRGTVKPGGNPTGYLLYMSFFPQIVSGPIDRSRELLPQFHQRHRPELVRISSGTKLALVGLAKKLVLADNLAPIVSRAFQSTDGLGLPALAVAVYALALQLYLDFSGYTDMARGVARAMGIDLGINFHFPYFSPEPSVFWQRWHISLSRWLRDYLFLPVSYFLMRHVDTDSRWNRKPENIAYAGGALVAMLAAGLWHGAGWTFLAWGIWHAFLLIAYRFLHATRVLRRLPPEGKGLVAFWLPVAVHFHLVCAGWLVFYFPSFGALLRMLEGVHPSSLGAGIIPIEVIKLTFIGIVVFLFELRSFRLNDPESWNRWSVRYSVPFFVLLFYAIVFLNAPEKVAFTYFRF